MIVELFHVWTLMLILIILPVIILVIVILLIIIKCCCYCGRGDLLVSFSFSSFSKSHIMFVLTYSLMSIFNSTATTPNLNSMLTEIYLCTMIRESFYFTQRSYYCYQDEGQRCAETRHKKQLHCPKSFIYSCPVPDVQLFSDMYGVQYGSKLHTAHCTSFAVGLCSSILCCGCCVGWMVRSVDGR